MQARRKTQEERGRLVGKTRIATTRHLFPLALTPERKLMRFHSSKRAEDGRNTVRQGVLFAFSLLLLLALTISPRNVQASTSTSVGPATEIFNANATGGAYRYGPSMIEDSTGLHVYTCSPGSNGAWDYIRYKTSTDGGQTWGPESIVLEPTPNSADKYSTCDPGIIYFGGYYYLGYTSTTDSRGTNNDVFVARSTSQTGPFDKWNGSGWGGNPQPFITFNGLTYDYGAGEPSFVVLGSTLYIYYTWSSHDSNGNPILQTRVATASTSNANWPGSITYQGVAISKRPDQAADSDDVKYVDAYSEFVAVNTIRRFTAKSYIQLWVSSDGIHFSPASMGRDNLMPFLHNDGLSGDASGHINISQTNYVGYAAGSQWADWNTYLNPITFSNDSLPAVPQIYTVEPKNGSIRLEFQIDPQATSYTLKYGTASGNYTSSVTGITSSPYTLSGLTNGTKYYLVMDGVNSNGSSPDSTQVSAIPQNYTQITFTNAVASSALSGWPASNVIDGNLNTNYSSNEHSTANATEWIYVDAGSNTAIGRLVIVDRAYQLAAPTFGNYLYTQIQVSEDATTWFNVDYRLAMYSIVDDDGITKTVVDFPQPLYGRYIRLYSTQLNPDDMGNYYLQLAEIQAYSVPVSAQASSYLTNWEPWRVLDADPNTVYSSHLHTSANNTEWVGLDLGSSQQLNRLQVTPRAGGLGFPVNFSIQSSNDDVNWTTIPGQSYTSYSNPGSNTQSFTFSSQVTARYMRLYATQLGLDNNGNYVLQLAQMQVQNSLPFTATASSQISGWPASNVADGLTATNWSSNGHSSANATEWLQLDLGSTQLVQDIRLAPRDGNCFPEGLSISYSNDGVNWTQAPGQSYDSYVDPSIYGSPNPVQLFNFSSLISARYFRITATQLRADSYGNYYFQIADAYVDQ